MLPLSFIGLVRPEPEELTIEVHAANAVRIEQGSLPSDVVIDCLFQRARRYGVAQQVRAKSKIEGGWTSGGPLNHQRRSLDSMQIRAGRDGGSVLLTVERDCGMMFLIENHHPTETIEISIRPDLSKTRNLAFSRVIAATTDFVPPLHRQILQVMTQDNTGKGWALSYVTSTRMHDLPSELHDPPLFGSNDIHRTVPIKLEAAR